MLYIFIISIFFAHILYLYFVMLCSAYKLYIYIYILIYIINYNNFLLKLKLILY